MTEIIICEKEKWLTEAVGLFIQQADANIADHGRFSVALAGGSTPCTSVFGISPT